MRADCARGRFLRGERGFTLSEMMVTMLIWIVVLFALYSLFDMSIRAFSFGNNNVEAMDSARLGLEKMEREIRQAYAFDRANGNMLILETWTPDLVKFGNDVDGNQKVECPNLDGACELITYKLTDDASNTACTGSPCTLRRVNTADSSDWGDPVVENVIPNDADPSTPNGLNFTFYESDGTTAETEAEIVKVLVSLEIAVNPGTSTEGAQRLTTEVDLRNR